MGEEAEENRLSYATGPAVAHLSGRGWRGLFWVGMVHLALVLGVLGMSWASGGLAGMYEFARELPRDRLFPIAFLITLGISPMMILVNVLGVRGYWAGLRRRSARKWFLVYAPVQGALVLLHWALLIYLAAAGPYTYTPAGGRLIPPRPAATTPTTFVVAAPSTLAVEVTGLYWLLPVHALIALPLTLLLVPRVRRACFS